MSFEKRQAGVVILPLISVKGGVAEFLTILPQEENALKLGEMCPLMPGATMRALAGMPEFPGGAFEVGEDVATAARREFTSEAGVSLDPSFESRLRVLLESFPIDQLRPELTLFAVAVTMLSLNECEIRAMEDRGASRVLVSLIDGTMIDKASGDGIELRPAHQAIVQYLCGIARSFDVVNDQVGVYA